MSDNNETDRDNSIRFVKRAAETAHRMHTPSDDGVHPMAKLLFGWTEWKGVGNVIFWGVLALSVVLILLDLLVDRHEYFHFADATGFYGLYGFGAFAFVVLMGWPLGRLLRRDANYYKDEGGPPADIDPDFEPDAVSDPTYGEDD